MPEEDEEFIVELWSSTGGARIGDTKTMKVIVNKNDHSVFIAGKLLVNTIHFNMFVEK